MDERTTDVPSLQYIFTCLTVGFKRQHTKPNWRPLIVKFCCGSTRLWIVDLQHFDNFMTT